MPRSPASVVQRDNTFLVLSNKLILRTFTDQEKAEHYARGWNQLNRLFKRQPKGPPVESPAGGDDTP